MKWSSRLWRYPEVWILTIAALFTRLWQLSTPNDIVFDEVYFREFASNYLSGAYFFDIHPPLIKLIFAGIGAIFGFSPEQVASGDEATLALRLLPAIAGALLVPLIYVIARQLGLGRRVAAFAGMLVLLDNALLVESRFVLMDSMLLLTGMGAVSCYLAFRKSRGGAKWGWLVSVAVLLGMTASTKWSGLAIVLLIFVLWIYDSMHTRIKRSRMMGEFTVVFATIAAIYAGSFAVHFALLPNSGEGDAFMSWRFQATLQGNSKYNPESNMPFINKFVELNTEMYESGGSVGEHPYSSRWNTWPAMTRPVYYWQGKEAADGSQGNIYLLGNPIIWWGSTMAAALLLILVVMGSRLVKKYQRVSVFLLAGYAVNFVPFIFISRPMFIYHYLFALIFAILITGLMFKLSLDWIAKDYGQKWVTRTYWASLAIVMAGFLFILPLSYGWPLSMNDLMNHMILPSWR